MKIAARIFGVVIRRLALLQSCMATAAGSWSKSSNWFRLHRLAWEQSLRPVPLTSRRSNSRTAPSPEYAAGLIL